VCVCLWLCLCLSVSVSLCVCARAARRAGQGSANPQWVWDIPSASPFSFFSLFLTFFLFFQPRFSPKVRGKRLWIPCPPTPTWTSLLMAPLVSNPCESIFFLGRAGAPYPTAPKVNTSQSRREPPSSQVLCFGGTGPIHTPLIKHLPPPVSTRKNPTVKSTSSCLRTLPALLCLSLLSCKEKSLFISSILFAQSRQALKSLTWNLSSRSQFPKRSQILSLEKQIPQHVRCEYLPSVLQASPSKTVTLSLCS